MDLKAEFNPAYISRLKGLSLQAKWVLEGVMTGRHRSPYHGYSSEFSQYKGYALGDDLKNLDWKVFGKNDQLVTRRYRDETNSNVYLAIDSSLSMHYGNPLSKLTYVKVLAASLGMLAFRQRDALALATGAGENINFLAPKNSASHFQRVLDTLEKLQPSGVTDLKMLFESIAVQIKSGSMVFVFTDLWHPDNTLREGLKALRAKHPAITLIHIQDPEEKSFFADGYLELEDLENQSKLKVSASHLRQQYLQTLQAHIQAIRNECEGLRMHYVPILTTMPYFEAVRRILTRGK